MVTKKKKTLNRIEAQSANILKKDLSFDQKRLRLEEIFKANKSVPKSSVAKIKSQLFSDFKDDLKSDIVDHFKLDSRLQVSEIEEFISFVGSDLLDPKFNNLKNKIKAFEKFKKINERDQISRNTIESILTDFHKHALARSNKRKIIYHCGPTNSGKTWGAMQALISANSGAYLAPLRLLAWEKYEELSAHHVAALITGEESNRPEGYTHSASTIEMANFRKKYEVAIIDEIQMIGDEQRGWSWTKALISIQADTVYLCGDDSAIDLVKKIVEMCGDELSVIHHERKSSLNMIEKVLKVEDVQKGDAIIVFSRKEALAQKLKFESMGLKVSIIYGLMTPEVRKEQARLFLDGITDIVISTDAIGMGLNLPIRRVIFTTIIKYFNKQEHVLTFSQIKQIAGRAGRFGLYPEGYVALLDQKYNPKWSFKRHSSKTSLMAEISSENIFMMNRIKVSLNKQLVPLKTAIAGPDYDTLAYVNEELVKSNHNVMNILEFFYVFKKIKTNEIFTKANIADLITQAEYLHEDINEEIQMDLSYFEDIFKFCVAPVMLYQEEHLEEFCRLYKNYFDQVPSSLKKISDRFYLDTCEMDLKCIELYQWLKNQLEEGFPSSLEDISKVKGILIDQINNFLIKKI